MLIICYSFTNSRTQDYNDLLFFREIESKNIIFEPNIKLGHPIFILIFQLLLQKYKEQLNLISII